MPPTNNAATTPPTPASGNVTNTTVASRQLRNAAEDVQRDAAHRYALVQRGQRVGQLVQEHGAEQQNGSEQAV